MTCKYIQNPCSEDGGVNIVFIFHMGLSRDLVRFITMTIEGQTEGSLLAYLY